MQRPFIALQIDHERLARVGLIRGREVQIGLEGVGKLKGKAGKRAEAALARIVREVEPLDVFAARDRFDALMAGRVEAAKGPDVGEAQA